MVRHVLVAAVALSGGCYRSHERDPTTGDVDAGGRPADSGRPFDGGVDSGASTCPPPYFGLAPDGRCVWSCTVGTMPSSALAECLCRPGLVEIDHDSSGRRMCGASGAVGDVACRDAEGRAEHCAIGSVCCLGGCCAVTGCVPEDTVEACALFNACDDDGDCAARTGLLHRCCGVLGIGGHLRFECRAHEDPACVTFVCRDDGDLACDPPRP
jgi:hypothetical protein